MSGGLADWILRAGSPREVSEHDVEPAFGFEGEPQRPLFTRRANNGGQAVYRFANGLGASVVRHSFSYGTESGLWELAVLRFTGPGREEFHLAYDTPVTDDVLGHLTDADVVARLVEIAGLP